MSRLSVVVLGIAWVGATFNPMPLKAQSALPEEVEIKLVNSMSDTLATRLNESNCADFNELLDGAQADAEKGSQSGIITQVLEDVKTNPKLRTIVITKLGAPLLTRTLDCNLTPVGALGADAAGIQDVTQLSTALSSLLGASDCPTFGQILDDAQANADTPSPDPNLAGVNQILAQTKTDSQAQSTMIATLGDPLLSKVLDCNLIPFQALR